MGSLTPVDSSLAASVANSCAASFFSKVHKPSFPLITSYLVFALSTLLPLFKGKKREALLGYIQGCRASWECGAGEGIESLHQDSFLLVKLLLILLGLILSLPRFTHRCPFISHGCSHLRQVTVPLLDKD